MTNHAVGSIRDSCRLAAIQAPSQPSTLPPSSIQPSPQ
jgi:hypothetical protein